VDFKRGVRNFCAPARARVAAAMTGPTDGNRLSGGFFGSAQKFVIRSVFTGSLLISFVVLASGSVRLAFSEAVLRSVARIVPLKYAFVGDSLTVGCSLGWRIGAAPFEAINFARGGADIRAVGGQVGQVVALRPKFLFIAAGGNDALEHVPTEQIAYQFKLLLSIIPESQRVVVTLIPYASDKAITDDITAANVTISTLVTERGMAIIDLNPLLSSDGVRKPEMTSDGIHMTERACEVWERMIKAQLAPE
jgi:hypothetical protein